MGLRILGFRVSLFRVGIIVVTFGLITVVDLLLCCWFLFRIEGLELRIFWLECGILRVGFGGGGVWGCCVVGVYPVRG